MMKTTPPPRFNVLEALPELADRATTATRIHPRRGKVKDLTASKIGGVFLYPEDEAWLTVPSKKPHFWSKSFDSDRFTWDFPDNTPVNLVPVIQLNKRDVPDFPFPDGKNLFQLFWQPLPVYGRPGQCLPKLIWRNIADVTSPRKTMPAPNYADSGYIPETCTLTFETVPEYPSVYDLTERQIRRLDRWLAKKTVIFEDDAPEYAEHRPVLYQFELSTCPDSKLGGYVNWIQDPETPTCANGHKMEHLLTLVDSGIDAGTWYRWLPVEDRELWKDPWKTGEISNAPNWSLGGGAMYYFVCRQCQPWITEVVYQR